MMLGTSPLSSGTALLTISTLTPGTRSIAAVYNGDSNFAVVASSAVSEVILDFTLTGGGTGSSGQTQTVQPGGTASYALAFAPTSGATFPDAVTLTVSGLSPGATATLTPASLPAGSSLTNVTLSVQLAATTARVVPAEPIDRRIPPLTWAVLLLPFFGRLRRAGKRMYSMLNLLLLSAAALVVTAGLSGCGGSNGFFAQQPQTYTVTVTATSGPLSHSTSVQLTVE